MPDNVIGSTDSNALATIVNDLRDEAFNARRTWDVMADDAVSVYAYGTSGGPDAKLHCADIQNHVIAATEIQTKEPPKPLLKPVETGEPGRMFYVGMGQPELGLTPGVEVMGAEGPDTVRVDDALVAEVFQSVLDVMWSRSNTDRRVRSNVLATNVYGWALWHYEWDDERMECVLRPMSVKQVYIDPTKEDISDAAYAGIDIYIDNSEAKRLYPHLADKLEANKTQGSLGGMNASVTAPAPWSELQAGRDVNLLTVFWLRNQLVRMTEAEALKSGKLTETIVVEPPAPVPEVSTVPLASVRRALVDQLGLEVTPESDAWPTRTAIRQVTVIADEVVDDRECEHWDIPLLHNVNIPVPGLPFGLGEPYRLRYMQESRSKMIRSMVRHSESFAFPALSMPQSMYNACIEAHGKAYLDPKAVRIVPDDLWQAMGGRIEVASPPPALSESLISAQSILKQEITEQSGHTRELRGISSSGQQSGRAIEMLQSAATTMIGYKASRTGWMVERLARLMLHCIVHRMGLEHIGKIISKYPEPVLAYMLERARTLEWDVSVEVVSGNEAKVAAKKAEALELFRMGLIGIQTAREQLGIDHKEEEERAQRVARQMMAQQAMAQQQTPGGIPNGTAGTEG